MSTLNSILPVDLRAHHLNYYSREQKPYNFVVIKTVGIAGFDINIGKWSHTSDSRTGREGTGLVTLCKPNTENKKNLGHFDQESPHIIRQDEFEWLLGEVQKYVIYNGMIGYASRGNHEAIVVHNYLLTLAKQFNTGAKVIFEHLNRFIYNPDELIKKPW